MSLTDNLIAHYTFGNLSNVTGNTDYDLVAYEGASASGGVLLLPNGSSGAYPTNEILIDQNGNDKFTVSLWFKDLVDRSTRDNGFLQFLADHPASPAGSLSHSGVANYLVAIYENDELGVYEAAEPAINSSFESTGFQMLPADYTGWHHLVLLHDSGTTTFYVDGVQAGAPVSFTPTDVIQVFGSFSTIDLGNGSTFDPQNSPAAAFDNIRVYNDLLSASDISELYTLEQNLPTAQYSLDGNVLDTQGIYDGSNSTVQYIADGDLDGQDVADLSAGAFNVSADLISDDVTSYTFSMWLKPSSFPTSGYRYIITDHAHAQNDDSIFIAVNSAGQIGIQHRGTPNSFGNHPRDTKFFGVAGSELTIGTWSHIAITWDGTDASSSNWEASLYKDSVHMQTVSMTQEPWDSPHPLFVGYENLGGGDTYHGYQGLMANLNFWDDQVLSSAEVQQVYNHESLVSSSSNSNENTNNTGENNMSFTNDSFNQLRLSTVDNALDPLNQKIKLTASAMDPQTGVYSYMPLTWADIQAQQSTEGLVDDPVIQISEYITDANYQMSLKLTGDGGSGHDGTSGWIAFTIEDDSNQPAGGLSAFSSSYDEVNFRPEIMPIQGLYTDPYSSYDNSGYSGDGHDSPGGTTGGDQTSYSYTPTWYRLKDDFDSSSLSWVYDNSLSYWTAEIPFTELDMDLSGLSSLNNQYPFNQVSFVNSSEADQTGSTSISVAQIQPGVQIDAGFTKIVLSVYNDPAAQDYSHVGGDASGNLPAQMDFYGLPASQDVEDLLPSGSGSGFDYSSIASGDYPLDNIMTELHDTPEGKRLDKVGTTQLKNRLVSSNSAGYRPRTMDTGLLLPVNYIEDIKSMTLDQALATGVHISQAEYDLMILPEDQGGFGYDHGDHAGASVPSSDGSYDSSKDPSVALLPEIPLVMMQDMYRAAIARLLDTDEAMFFDASSSYAASAMAAHSLQGMPIGANGGGLLIAKNDLSVSYDLTAAKLEMGDQLNLAGDLDVRDQSNGHIRTFIVAGSMNTEKAAHLGMSHTFQQLIAMGWMTEAEAEANYTQAPGVPAELLANRSLSDLGHVVQVAGNLTVDGLATFKKHVLIESSLNILDNSAGANGSMRVDQQADIGGNLLVDADDSAVSTLTGKVTVGLYGGTGIDTDPYTITTPADLKVDLLLDVNGSFEAGAEYAPKVSAFDLDATGLVSLVSDASSATSPAINIDSGNDSNIKFEVPDAKLIKFQEDASALTKFDNDLQVGDSEGDLTVGGVAIFGVDGGAAELVHIQDNLVMDAAKVGSDGDSNFTGDVDVKADTGTSNLNLSGDATLNKEAAVRTTGTQIDTDLLVRDGELDGDSNPIPSGSQVELQITVGADAPAGMSTMDVKSGLIVGSAQVPSAVAIAPATDATASYADGGTIEAKSAISATGNLDIVSNDPAPDNQDLDIKLLASDKIVMSAQSIEIGDAAESGTISFADDMEVKHSVTVEISPSSGAVEAFKMENNSVSKASIVVDDTSTGPDGVLPSVQMVINNVSSTPVQGGALSVDGTLKVAGTLFQALNASDEFRAGAGLDVKVFDNILSISHESDQLSWEELDAHQATAGVGTQDAIRAAAVAEFQPEGYSSSETDASVTAALWSELTPAQLMKVPSDATYQVDRSSNSSYEIPRTNQLHAGADGMYFWLPSSGETHADQAAFLNKPINVGPRAFVVAPGHGDNVGSDQTVMSIVAGTDLDLGNTGANGDTTYLAMQAGETTLEGQVRVQEPSATPTWFEMLLRARRYEDGDDISNGMMSSYAKVIYAFNDIMPVHAAFAGETWASMSASEVDDELYAYSQDPSGASLISIAGVPVMGKDYDGPDLFAANGMFRVADSANARMIGTDIKFVQAGASKKLHVKQAAGKIGTQRITSTDEAGSSTSPALLVTNGSGLVPSKVGGFLQSGTAAADNVLTLIDISGGQYMQHDPIRGLASAGDANGRIALSGDADLRSSDSSHDLKADDVKIEGILEVLDELQVRGSVGLGQTSNTVRAWGELEVNHLPSDDDTTPQKSKIQENVMVGENADVPGTAVAEFDATSAIASWQRIGSSLDSSREIYATGRAEFEVRDLDDSKVADALFGGDVGLNGSTRKDLIAAGDINFGHDHSKGFLKAKEEILLQDSFTVASQGYYDNGGTAVTLKGYTFAASKDVLTSMVRAGVDVLRTLTWAEAAASDYKTDTELQAYVTGGGDPDDLTDISFISLMASITAAQEATGGFTHQERITGFVQAGQPVVLDAPVHNALSGNAADNDTVAPASFKGKLEVYLNGVRVPDSEYEVLYSEEAAKKGKQLSFYKNLERRDTLIIDSRVANPG